MTLDGILDGLVHGDGRIGKSLELDFHRVGKDLGFVLVFIVSCSIVIDKWLRCGLFAKELSI